MSDAHTFHLVVSSVAETFFDGPVVSATFPGSEGELTVLAGHEPLVTPLKQGTITARLTTGETKQFQNENGILECSGSRVVVLL